MKKGDKVKFIYKINEGVITKIIDDKTIAVRTDEELEVKIPVTQILNETLSKTIPQISATRLPSAYKRLRELAAIAIDLSEGKYHETGFEPKADDEVGQVEKALYEIGRNLDIQKRRQSAQHAATKVLEKADSLADAMPEILKAICKGLGWQWAGMWTIDNNSNILRCGKIWQAPMTYIDEFSELCKQYTFEKGVGLPGRVWADGQPAWIIDVQKDANFPRQTVAKKVGLHGAFCFPLQSAYGPLGVMEFLTINSEEPDNSLLAMMNAIGSQIGQFIERKLALELSAKKIAEIEEIHFKMERDFSLRMEDSKRTNAQHAATKVLADAPGLSDATPRLLQAICEGLGWECALMWEVDEAANVLNWVDTWHALDMDFSEFEMMSRNMNFSKGRGLPGRVWENGEPLWILDVVKDSNFPRAPAAEKVGLHGAFAFPVRLKEKVLGVMEFFSKKVQEPDDALLAMMSAVGSQIGQFIERKNAESKAKIYLTEVEHQKELVEEKQKEVMDSINYAQRIQRSLLASDKLLNKHLPEYFIFFQPKDIVSGDFFWASPLPNNQFALVTADSTGHGVPGAIMSMLNISCLSEAVHGKKLIEPNEILNHTRTKIIDHLSNDGSISGGKDGMDCSLLRFDFNNNKVTYCAANNPVWIVRSNTVVSIERTEIEQESQLLEFPADKMPVGKHDRDYITFTQHTIDLQKGDIVYTLTDGMPDQFGGPKGKKFMYKQLKELILSISHLTMQEQKNTLESTINQWKGDQEQVDDILLIGVQI